jgi:hypothetical protein
VATPRPVVGDSSLSHCRIVSSPKMVCVCAVTRLTKASMGQLKFSVRDYPNFRSVFSTSQGYLWNITNNLQQLIKLKTKFSHTLAGLSSITKKEEIESI